jgi:hypothetical protein
VPVDPRKRQKKLERRKAKHKAERRQLARRESAGLPAHFQRAAAAPVMHCVVANDVWEQGIGNVLISRQLPHGDVAFVVFLLDMYCLGAKDVILGIAPQAAYQQNVYEKMSRRGKLIPIKPECARKLVEGAVQYALDLGLSPHADYRTARLIFGDISAEACSEEYVYGKHGKPCFIAGPYDDPTKCEHILRALQKHCGHDGYHFALPTEVIESDVTVTPEQVTPEQLGEPPSAISHEPDDAS